MVVELSLTNRYEDNLWCPQATIHQLQPIFYVQAESVFFYFFIFLFSLVDILEALFFSISE